MIEISLGKNLGSAESALKIELHTTLEPGSLTALFGPSGAGKTTVLRMLAGLTVPDEGRIVVGDKVWYDAASGVHVAPCHRPIGFAFQDYALFPNMTVRGNIAYGAGRDERQWIDELLDLMELTAASDRLPATLSGGQKQRVALARALARRPSLLLLDEPFSALDGSLRSRLQERLLALHHRLEMTTLLVSHDIAEAFRLAQRVLRLEHGRIVSDGTPDEVFLASSGSGELRLHAQVLAIRPAAEGRLISLLVGSDIIHVNATEREAEDLVPGAMVSIAARAGDSPIFR